MKKKNKPGKFLLALQYWESDKNAANNLAKLIADIQDKHPDPRAEFLMVAKKGTTHDQAVLSRLSLSFVTNAFTTRYPVDGWPDGPNAVWRETMLWVLMRIREGQSWECVLTFEPDCVPLRLDWIGLLWQEWERAKAMGKLFVGDLIPSTPPHINGNMIVDAKVFEKLPRIQMAPSKYAWDAYHAATITAVGMDTPRIVSRYKTQTITEDGLYQPKTAGIPTAFHHGVKDGSDHLIVRKVLLNEDKKIVHSVAARPDHVNHL